MRSPSFILIGLTLLIAVDASSLELRARQSFTLAEDSLGVSIGTVVDAAVDRSGSVYLLDSQSMQVWQVESSGDRVIGWTRAGEGPGELERPLALAAAKDRVVVVQDLGPPWACLSAPGNPVDCGYSSLAGLGFQVVVPTRAEQTASGTVVLAAVLSNVKDVRRRVVSSAYSLISLDATTGSAVRLFSTDAPELFRRLDPGYGSTLLHGGWDLSPDGTKLVVAGVGSGHHLAVLDAAGSRLRTIDLDHVDDEAAIAALAERTGMEGKRIPRVVRVFWVDDDVIATQPSAIYGDESAAGFGELDFYSADGRYLGRHGLQCEFDRHNDSVWVRRGRVVVLRGGRVERRAEASRLAQLAGIGDVAVRGQDYDEPWRLTCFDLGPIANTLRSLMKPPGQ